MFTTIQQTNYFYYHSVLIAKCKISVLATPVTSLNPRNQAPLFTELRLLQGTNILSFCIFWMVFMSLIVIATPWQFSLLLL